MKKSSRILLVCLLSLGLASTAFAGSGLSLESHMDFDRQLFTETFTGWADDSTGGWFFFIDLDTSGKDSGSKYSFGYNNNYFEINRDFSFGKLFGDKGLEPLSLHLEYNGTAKGKFGATCYYLAGLKYEFSGYPYIFTASASAKLARNYDGTPEPDMSWQLTLVWNLTFSNGLFNFNGFVDVWNNTEYKLAGGDNKLGILTEPQFMVNLGKLFNGKKTECLWLGTEIEIAKNAYSWTDDGDKVKIRPTVFLRYDF